MLKKIYGMIFIFALLLCCAEAYADHIRFLKNIAECFVYKDWVSYEIQNGDCRPVTEFIAGNTIASLAVLKSDMFSIEPYYFYVYGEYVKSFVIELNGKEIKDGKISKEILNEIANNDYLEATIVLYTEYYKDKPEIAETKEVVARISLAGSSAAFRFCGFIE